ncbi:methyl-accepting chemotaxis protein [Viridibacillus sp. YIM B01967]|uniref:Methyl-accepting chemotaxis protein n=1 Tax=Viridibacillus soli TaxID=2798301 RepID=A0ABS1H441_9BACL|nr:methyl-accepting chemotaxis protein [Viridibacillus soli]MBK3494171.1 methyl-accepting chemotaxis protein [Viridibacillus soli]
MKKLFGSLKRKLYISFALVLLIPVVSVGILSYLSAKDSIEKEILHSANESVEVLNTLIDKTLSQKVSEIGVFSKEINASKYAKDAASLKSSLEQYDKLNPDVLSIFVATTNGAFIQGEDVPTAPNYNPLDSSWYKGAVELKGELYITEPYVDARTGEMIFTIAQQLKDRSGVVGVDIELTNIQQVAESISIGENGYSSIFDENKKVVSHPTLKGGGEVKESFFDKMYEKDNGTYDYVYEGDKRILTFTTNKLTDWKITGTIFSKEIDNAASPILFTTILVLAVAIVASSIAVYFVIKAITKPIGNLKECAVTISKGDLTEKVDIKSNDEIGQLGQAFNDMQDSLRTLIQKVEINAEQVASSAEELTANADQTSMATEQVAIAIQEVSSSADTQTTHADKNAEALNELSNSILHIAESSSTVTDLSQHATKQAEEGGEAVQNTKNQMNSIHMSVTESNTKIQTLHERSQQITSILDVIASIAEQTNLLSLNAAIEAARAGEHGKGFAVVADEVRKLADQSQQSAKQIFELIHGIQADTEQSVLIMAKVTEDVLNGLQVSDEAIAKFHLIMTSMKEITPQMEEVSATSEQMSASVQEITASTEDLAFSAKENAATSEEVAASTEEQLASMEEINASAQALSHMADELKGLISQFKY